MKQFHSLIFLLILTIFPPFAYSADTQEDRDAYKIGSALLEEISKIRAEYAYYYHKFNDVNRFPATREQELLPYIENKYLKDKDIRWIHRDFNPLSRRDINPLSRVPNVEFAKLFLLYQANPFGIDGKFAYRNPLLKAVSQQYIERDDVPNLTHPQIIDVIEAGNDTWFGEQLPPNNAIALAKLYIALGADIYKSYTNYSKIKVDAVIASLYRYVLSEGGNNSPSEASLYDKQHNADDLVMPFSDELEHNYFTYYRSPVTYWLEEFIDKGYPASMLDTHQILYPHFMKTASVTEVMDMLNNPDAHKIPANQNCPYKETCSLIPSINMRDAMGRTPLHIAGEQGNQAVFNALIQIGADESVKDYRGNVALIIS